MKTVLSGVLAVYIFFCLKSITISGEKTETHINNDTYQLDAVKDTKSGTLKDGTNYNKTEESGKWRIKGTDGSISYGVFSNSQIIEKGFGGKPGKGFKNILNFKSSKLPQETKGQEKEQSGVDDQGRKWTQKTSGDEYTSPDGTVKYGWSKNSKTLTDDDENKDRGWGWFGSKPARPKSNNNNHGGWGGNGWLFGGNRRNQVDDSLCESLGYVCQHVDKPCNGIVLTDAGLCGGGLFRKCCSNIAKGVAMPFGR